MKSFGKILAPLAVVTSLSMPQSLAAKEKPITPKTSTEDILKSDISLLDVSNFVQKAIHSCTPEHSLDEITSDTFKPSNNLDELSCIATKKQDSLNGKSSQSEITRQFDQELAEKIITIIKENFTDAPISDLTKYVEKITSPEVRKFFEEKILNLIKETESKISNPSNVTTEIDHQFFLRDHYLFQYISLAKLIKNPEVLKEANIFIDNLILQRLSLFNYEQLNRHEFLNNLERAKKFYQALYSSENKKKAESSLAPLVQHYTSGKYLSK